MLYYIVNPAGAIHDVTRSHAERLLGLPGYRNASPDEVALLRQTPVQRFDRPLCAPFRPTPIPVGVEDDDE